MRDSLTPWVGVVGLALLVAACWAMERRTLPVWAIAALGSGLLLWIWVAWAAPPEPDRLGALDPPAPRPRPIPLALAVAAAGFSWWKTTGDEFRLAGALPWLAGLALWLWAWWPARAGGEADQAHPTGRRRKWAIRCALAGILLVGMFFQFYRLSEIPSNPVSDHAEEMLDMLDLLNGQYRIFFFRNLGREPFQFYWTCTVMKVLGLPLSYLTLKVATALIGVLTVLALYLAGRELGGAWLGLSAAAFVAWGKWHVSLARQGLDYTYAVLPTALVVWALLRYLRRGDRLSALAAGVSIGAGLYGYTPFRIVPLLVPLVLAVALFDARRGGTRWRLLGDGLLIAATSVLVFLPLFKFMLFAEHRAHFWYRSATRATSMETAVAGDPLRIFAGNIVNMLKAFHWRGSTTWTVTVQEDPFLDVVLGGLLLTGLILGIVYIVRGSWRWSWLLPAAFVLTLPSTLSLAFPNENPSLNRAGAAIPVIFLLAALPFAYLCRRFSRERAGQRAMGLTALAVFALLSIQQNAQRYFVEFHRQDQNLLEPSVQMAAVLKRYHARGLPYSQAYLLAVDNWVDGRNIAFEVGEPDWGEAHLIAPPEIPRIPARPLAFLFHPSDTARRESLRELYPSGEETVFLQKFEDRNFGVYYVPK